MNIIKLYVLGKCEATLKTEKFPKEENDLLDILGYKEFIMALD